MEIERKFTVKELPDLSQFAFHVMEQGYLNTDPVVRVRKEDDNSNTRGILNSPS